MVRGKDFVNGRGYSEKHLSANDYYEKGRKVEGRWIGKACAEYGVKAGCIVQDRQFEALRENKHAKTGKQITARQNTTRQSWIVNEKTGNLEAVAVPNRREFYDFTIGAPKTFSIAAVTGADPRVKEWHDLAVQKVIAEMESLTARRDHDNETWMEISGKFVAAWYKHTANRCLEPHVHDHIVIFNMTPGAGEKSYAVQARQWMDNSRYLTAIYWDELAAQARTAGVELARDKHGAPQIKSLVDLVDMYSRRTKEIKTLIETFEERVGVELSNAERKTIVLASRGLDMVQFERLWEQNKASFARLNELQSTDAQRGKLRQDQLQKFKGLIRSPFVYDGRLAETTTDAVLADQLALLNPEQRDRIISFKSERGIPQPKTAGLEEAIEFTILHCFERQSVVKDFELHEQIVLAAQGSGVDLARMKELLAGDSELIRSQYGEYTTKTHLVQELEMVRCIENGKERGVTLSSSLPISDDLSRNQALAVRKILECRDQFSLLLGKAGTGKTRSLAEIVEQNVAHGYKVFVSAPDNGPRDVLRNEADSLKDGRIASIFAGAENIHRFLADPKLHRSLGAGDLLILDEAGKASVEKVHELVEWARASRCRVLLVGDPRQHSSIEAGDALAILVRLSGITKARLSEIIRQKKQALDGHYLKAAKLFSEGKTIQAFARLDQAGAITEYKSKERIEALADAILSEQDLGRSVVAINPPHRENDALAEVVRSRLKDRGNLTDERTVKVHRSLGWTYAERRRISQIKPGQILEITRGRDKGKAWRVVSVTRGKAIAINGTSQPRTFTRSNAAVFDVCEERDLQVAIGDKLITYAGQRAKNGEIINGERVTVTGWTPEGDIIGEKGKVISVRNLSHAYAATSHKSQGVTADTVIFGLDRHSIKWADQKLAYVAGTRGRINIRVFVESKAELIGIEKRSGERKAATDLRFIRSKSVDVRRLVAELAALREKQRAVATMGMER
jgi:conjugative relaxase-like TrwC/TraI family protein